MTTGPSRVYVLTGMPGAGKEEFVQMALSRECSVVRMGDVVRSEAERRGISMDDRGVGGFASAEREACGPGIWASRCVPLLGGGTMVIDGSRSVAEMEVFRKELGDRVRLIAVHTSPRLRFERLQKRGRYDAPKGCEEFRARDARELGWGLGSLIALADVMLVNEGTLEEFRHMAGKELDRPW